MIRTVVALVLIIFSQSAIAQQAGEAQKAKIPPFRVEVYFNGKPADPLKGAPANARITDIKIINNESPLGSVLLKEAVVSLARGSRSVSTVVYDPTTKMYPVLGGSLPGDRLVIELSELYHIKPEGGQTKLNMRPIYNVPLY